MADAEYDISETPSRPSPSPTRRGILAGIPGAAVGIGALASLALAGAAHPDAELIRLGRELDTAWKAEKAVLATTTDDEVIDAAMNTSQAIVERIEDHPAKTIAGLKVKAMALSWCHSGDRIEPAAFSSQGTTDVRLIVAIANDILAI